MTNLQFEYSPPQTDLEQALGGHRCINAFGSIKPLDDQRFAHFLASTEAPPRTDLYIHSTGGDVEAGLNIGRMVRDNWLSTHVGSYVLDPDAYETSGFIVSRRLVDGFCMSAATLVYLGGRLRYLSHGAVFGVHRFSFRNPSPNDDIAKSQILSSRIARYIADMGIPPQFLEASASVDADEINALDHTELRNLGIVTDGELPVRWTMESRNTVLYAKGERDSFYGHHKLLACYTRPTFYIHAVIESQGREQELTEFPLVELVVGMDESHIRDVSARCSREVTGPYTNIIVESTLQEAHELVHSNGFGLRLRANSNSPIFLGIAPMSTKTGRDLLTSFVHNVSPA